MITPGDVRFMRTALALAQRAIGRAAPNPAVGCVLVSPAGVIVGRGWTGQGGRPHAETVALGQAGEGARGAAAYVTLEPCSHYAETPPCAEALVASGISRVVAAVEDPDPRVGGRGLERLRSSGVEVTTGVLREEAVELNAGFFLRIHEQRPLVTLKIAASIDGRTAAPGGQSRWITGEAARRFGHLLRARNDAILVGLETALADDPMLTCRLSGLEDRSPLRVVLDSRLRLPEISRLVRTARDVPTLVFTVAEGGGTLRAAGVEVVCVAKDPRGRPDIGIVLRELAARGITRLLAEGGSSVHASFLDREFADRIELFRGPLALGTAGHAAIDAIAALSLDEAPRFICTGTLRLGSDLLESFKTASQSA